MKSIRQKRDFWPIHGAFRAAPGSRPALEAISYEL